MKPRISDQKKRAFTLPELLVIVAILALFAFIVCSITDTPREQRQAQRINCVSNLKQINLALRIWEEDNHNKYPMSVSVTNYGGMELITAGNVAGCFQVTSNELGTPKILICPADADHVFATNFATLNNSNISYFLNPDVTEAYPQQIMIGDDNFAIGGVPVKSGLLVVPSNGSLSWTGARHHFAGNIGFSDGSILQASLTGLQSALALSTNGTPFTTNWFAIP